MPGRVVTDTSDFFTIDYGDILKAGQKQYRIIGHAKEKRFGVEDPKFWVKRGIEMGYETYHRTKLPNILRFLVKAFEAIRFSHIHGFRHGDIRNDHMIIENETPCLGGTKF